MWRDITGYYWPYRLSDEATLERQQADGSWSQVATFMSRRRLMAHMRLANGSYQNVPIKRLMVAAYLRKLTPGEAVGFRSGLASDCSLSNLYIAPQRKICAKGGGSMRRSVELVNYSGEVVEVYASVSAAAKAQHVDRKTVYTRCNGLMKRCTYLANGCTFRYEELDGRRRKRPTQKGGDIYNGPLD